jgi:acetyl esterase/lipase
MKLMLTWTFIGSCIFVAFFAYALSPTMSDLSYGSDKAQQLDVYKPDHPNHAPIIFMVHGGGWRIGDKQNSRVVENKALHFMSRGFLFISVNYRMSDGVTPLDEAADIASALRYVSTNASQWGGDPTRIIVMGHSAGAHLVSLLAADPARWRLTPWLGTISLDSAAYDVSAIMIRRHFRLYDQAFGNDSGFWHEASPLYRLSKNATPLFLVCSTRRDNSCPQAHTFANRAREFGVHAEVLEEDLSHSEINEELGAQNSYTDAIDAFIASLPIQ